MRKKDEAPRFGPGNWVTLRDTGEHVKVEAWSGIAAAYRVHSRRSGLQFVSDAELVELSTHPEADLGRHWHRCQAPGCGAPLTPELPVCEACGALKCTCGRCQCARTVAKPIRKTARKRAPARA